jgi:ribosomal protein L11 methylase PrmA
VQILVVVANVQARILKTVVEKGFALTAIVRKIVGPKKNGNTISICGRRLIINLLRFVIN